MSQERPPFNRSSARLCRGAAGACHISLSAIDSKAVCIPEKHGEGIAATWEMIPGASTRFANRILPHMAWAPTFALNDLIHGL